MRRLLKSRAAIFVATIIFLNACAIWVQAFFYGGMRTFAAEQQLVEKIVSVKGHDQLLTSEGDSILSLWGIMNPYVDERRAGQNQAIIKRIEQLLLPPEHKEISISLAEQRTDHEGRRLVHVVVDGQNVVETLLAAGLTIYWPNDEGQLPVELDQAYRMAELEARDKKVGIWQQPNELLICADNALSRRGKPALVMGKVHSVSQSGARMFINYSPDWDKDFTVLIESAATRREVQAMSIEAGDYLLVRGWVEHWRGPFVKLSDARRLVKLSAEGLRNSPCN